MGLARSSATPAHVPLPLRVIGSVAGPLSRVPNAAGESALGDVIADAAQTGSKTWGGNVVTFISPRELHASLPAEGYQGGHGPVSITWGMGRAAVPLRQGLTTIIITGAALRQALEQQFGNPGPGRDTILQVSSGLAYTWHPAQPAGQRVDPASLTIDGTAVSPGASYRVTVGNVLRDPAAGFPAFASAPTIPDGADTGQELDLLAAYLATRSPLPVPALGRITRASA